MPDQVYKNNHRTEQQTNQRQIRIISDILSVFFGPGSNLGLGEETPSAERLLHGALQYAGGLFSFLIERGYMVFKMPI